MNLENLNIDKRQLIIFAFAAVLLLALFVYWQFFYSPKKKSISAILDKVKDFDVNIKEEEARMKAQGYEQEIARMQQEIRRLQNKFPSQNELPGVFKELFNQADKFNVEVISIEPQEPQLYKSSLESESDLVFNRVPIRLELQASFRALAEFLKALFDNPQYAFGFDGLNIDRVDPLSSKLDIKLLLDAFVLSHKGAISTGPGLDINKIKKRR